MNVRAALKKMMGRALSTDFTERLTEYGLEREESVALSESDHILMPGTSWSEVADAGRKVLWRKTLDRIGTDDILLLEFGVWRGESMREFLSLNTAPNSRFYGFDSFQGLPEVWRGTSREFFNLDGEIPDIPDNRLRFVKGWFNQTLVPMLPELQRMAEGRAVVVHFDADLYSSTLFVLFALSRIFPDYYFIFDEYAGHETRALYNFLQATGGRCDFFYHVLWEEFPTSVSGHLRTLEEGSRSAAEALPRS